MKSTRRGSALRKLLDLCDDLQSLRTKMIDPQLQRETRARLRRQARTKTDQLARDLSKYRFRGPLGQLMREFAFDLVHFQVLATLLHHHFRADSPALEGRRILAPIFENSFEMLAGMELLQDNGLLRASGLVVLEDDEECTEDVLEARFRLSEDALAAFRDEIDGLVIDDQSGRTACYGSNHEYLIDLRILHNLFKHRSERVFQQDRWDRIHASPLAPGRNLTRRIESFWRKIHRKLQRTPTAKDFPAVRFFRDHQLDRQELVIVVHLLFKELYEGNAYDDAAELIRLVSADELDLVRNRRLIDKSGNLLGKEIIHIESMLEGRELTGEIYLSDWAVNYLFGAMPPDPELSPDARLDWHLYLKNLEDSQSFFRDLETN